ncbi:hypothetical protein ACFPVX_15065 [Cohnella faecalis]|uniref:hypothetical protein n=1 Tax=Cohnella faecalis TaxID=2315694 RepID=UPI0011C23FA2|nr:hypothetical protein [Cohnella faecalis]
MQRKQPTVLFMLALIVCFVILTSCGTSKRYVVFAESTVLTDISRASLEKRLSDKKIDFIVNDAGDILVQKSDLNKATVCCS